MYPDVAKLTAGLLLANSSMADNPIAEYGLVGLIVWMVLRELFSLINKLIDRKRNGASGATDSEVAFLRERLAELQQSVIEQREIIIAMQRDRK